MADSLLSALGTFWTANSLNAVIAPLYARAAPPGLEPPYIVADGFRQDLPGHDKDTIPIEVYFSVFATSGLVVRQIGRLLGEWLESSRKLTPDTSAVVNPNRTTAFTWTVGYEHCCERNETRIDTISRPGVNGRQFRLRTHYTFWISGRP
jgi:hypothetical protein